MEREVFLKVGEVELAGTLTLPDGASGIVLFAHGSGSSRHSPRNRYAASVLQSAGHGTLLMDLLSREEEAADARTGHLRFEIGLLASRLTGATEWLRAQDETKALRAGYFGAFRGQAARGEGGRLSRRTARPGRYSAAHVEAPTLLIVGGHDEPVIELNREAYGLLRCEKELTIVPGASHLFEEPGTLAEVARLASEWFTRHL